MSIGAFFLILAVLILVGMYLYTPFLKSGGRIISDEQHVISALMAERDRVINALHELDFDFNLGKIPTEDYPLQRTALLQKGADILHKLDELAPAPNKKKGDTEARIERAAAARRADAAGDTSDFSDDDFESLIAARRKERKEKSAGFCPRCGKPVLISDRFCPACGKSLT